MGKNKGQRTKNNARPSNSNRSAELLGASAPGFVGFTAAKDGGYVPFLPGLSIANNSAINDIDPTFQVVFKKMNKKDATTKYKALVEFSELCTNSELATVEAVLPCWPHLYSLLSTDLDHRVREAAQLAHAALIKKVGKLIAVCLKQLAGPWFVSQYDMYPPAASAAANCFNTTFPQHKFESALIHCRKEILEYICDNIINLSPQSFATNKSLTPEELEAKYQRLVTSSLQAYSFILKTIDTENTAEYHKKLISSNKFWKLAKNEVPATKTAFFNALTALICYANNIVNEEKRKVLTTIMSSLDETEPALLTTVWESLLVAINKIEDWQKVVNVEKLVLSKLWKVLKNGGQCCATVVYPNLLPFLSQFTKFEINKEILLKNFFDNMRQGFSAKSVKLSRSETFAVVTSFFECFRYAILVSSTNENFCIVLLKEELMPLIESCLCENQSVRSIFFCELSHLLRYWSKNSNKSEYPTYVKLMKIFWFDLIAIFNRIVDNSNDNYGTTISSIVINIAELLMYLKNAPYHSRRNMKVKFSDSAPESDIQPTSPSLSLPTIVSDDDNAAFIKELQQFVIKLCVSYFKKIMDKPFEHKVINLVKIITGNESKELFTALAKAYDESGSLLQFYNQNLKTLMTIENEEIEALINLIFSIMSHMCNEEKKVVLQSFQEIENINILKIAVQYALMKKYEDDNVIRNWCKQDVITNTLVLTAQDVLSSLDFTDIDEKMFLQAFEPAENGELFVSYEAIVGMSSLLSLMVDRMPWNKEKYVHRIANLLSRLTSLSWTQKEYNPGELKLLKALFRLHMRDITERSEEDGESLTVKIVEETWTKGILKLSNRFSPASFASHVKYFASLIWEKMLQTNDIFKDSLIKLSTSFINALIQTKPRYSQKLVVTFMIELEIQKWMKNVFGIVFYGELITGNLYASTLTQKAQMFDSLFDVDLSSDNFHDDTYKCLKWAAASTKIVNKLLANTADFPEISNILIELVFVATLGEMYLKHYNSTKFSNDVNALQKKFHEELNTLKTFLSEDVHNKVVSDIYQLLLSYGGIYPNVLKFYYNFFTPKNELSKLFEDNALLTTNTSNNIGIFLQCTQVLNDCPNLEKIKSFPDDSSDFYKIFLAKMQFNEDEITLLGEVFERITKRQKSKPLTLLLDCDVHNVEWKNFVMPLEIISFFTKCVTTVPKKLTLPQWDVIEICLASWSLSVKKSIEHYKNVKVRALIVGVNKLYSAIQQIMNEYAKTPIEELPPSLFEEWKNVFSNDLQSEIFNTWMTFAELYKEKDMPIVSIILLNFLGKSLKFFDEPIIKMELSEYKSSNKSEEQTLQLLLKLIHCHILSLQLGSYIALNNIVEVFVKRDSAIIIEEDYEIKSLNICKFEQILKTAQTVVNTILMDFKLCDTVSCTIQPHTDSYTYTIGYLLTWGLVLNMCAKANADLRCNYAEILKDDYFPSLMNNIFRLMPIEVLQDTKNKNYKLTEIFSTVPSFDFTDSWTEWRLDHLVCWVYTNCLRYLPVLVRQWWSTADSRVSAAVDKITTVYVSPFLCNEELRDNRLTNFDNMQVKVHPAAREVISLYQMDDTKLELNIILPINHPLGTVIVEPGQHAGGTPNWRNCHMQLSIFLTHQNGSIWDGLMLWKQNLDKKFAGVEECYICFSIFHISTYQIPKLSCRTCRKKFHKPCLFKWFNTSHKSTCPICRNQF
ncbi:E3 ubiquitin-protein ligase listerin [Phymastichus coffea]|uniref:E3 ubiquitin-protein ligase listerin n=1 Tax=Phymastichus coffea TaxID=108790 RepID=UPI00273CCF80|nr:E3 ubiquitin-protein ligase listerin [Phymastichus coffea]